MSLLAKTDYFGLSGSGWVVSDNSENKSVGYTAEAQGPDGFLVAVDAGPDNASPACDYVATSTATLTSVTLGSVQSVMVGGSSRKIALGSITINTAAGQNPTLNATGQEIENNGSAGCTCTLGSITVSPLFHAQDFGLFTVTNGQLTQSTLTINGDIGTAMVDGVIKASDLVGGSVTVTGTIVGVNDSGVISTPTITTLTADLGNVGPGVVTQPLTLTNSNGQFPSYSFTVTYPLKADSE